MRETPASSTGCSKQGESCLIGLVMLNMGLLNNFQLINVLKEMEGQAAP